MDQYLAMSIKEVMSRFPGVEQVLDEYGIGNGVSLIIMAGIISRMPAAVSSLVAQFSAANPGSGDMTIGKLAVILVLFVAMTLAVVMITLGTRRVAVQQSKATRGRKVYGGQRQFLPLRVNQAGVIPIIFAQALLGVFPLLGGLIPFFGIYFGMGTFWYTVMYVVLIMFFLHGFQEGPAIDWRLHVFGYLATIGLVGTTIFALRGRIRKVETHYKHSHETDWIFLVLLLYVAVTGIVQHALHRLGLDVGANVVYLAHMMGVVPMLVLEVPFSKWAHLAYRPLAMYFSELQGAAILAREKSAAPAAQAQAA